VESTNINLTDGSFVEFPTEDPSLVFAKTGFNFLADAAKDTVGGQIAAKASDVAPGAQTLELQAIKTSDDTGQCEAALQGSKLIQLAFECVNPTTCTASQVSANATSIAGNNFGAALTYTNVSLDFGDASDTTALLVIFYPDVGKIKLHAKNTLSPSLENMLGGSNEFVVRPFAFDVSVTGNPGATGASGTIFTSAGTNFTVTARAVLWEAADDADNDGQADGHGDTDPNNNADLSGNSVALNYGQETVTEAIALAATLAAPSPGNDPGLLGTTSISSFSSGSGNVTGAHYDEVGVMEVSSSISDNDYLGIGATETAKILGHSGPVGRFTPADFGVATNTPVFGSACSGGGFSYLGQPFDYSTQPLLTVTAQNASGGTTQNYKASWFKLTNTSLSDPNYAVFAGTLDTSGLPLPSADPNVADNGDGTATLTFGSGIGLAFTRTSPVIPFNADIRLRINVADSDAVTSSSNPVDFGAATAGGGISFSSGKGMRFGRLVVTNAHGTELLDLAVPIQAQYYNASGYWIDNGDDSCSTLNAGTDLNLTQFPPALSSAAIAYDPFLLGDPGLSFTKPGMNNTGYIEIEVDLATATGADLEWLYYDWDGDTFYDNNPTGRATFGVYRGTKSMIFLRELY